MSIDLAKKFFLEGNAHLEKGDYAQAEQCFIRTLTYAPRSVPTLSNLANVQYTQKKFIDCIATAHTLIEIDHNNLDAYELLSSSHKEQGDYQEALSLCDKLLEIDPTLAEAHCNRAYLLNKLHRHQEANESCDRALAINPAFADAHLNRASAQQNLKLHEEALASYDEALAIKPDLAEAWLGRGNVLITLKRYDEALAAYDKALSINPDLERAWLGRGDSLSELRRHADALIAYDKALAVNSDSAEGWLGRAIAFFALGQTQNVLQAATRAIELNESPAARIVFASCAKSIHFTADDGKFRKLLLRALTEGWIRPGELGGACISLIKLNTAVREGIARAEAAWPRRLSREKLLGAVPISAVANDELLLGLLDSVAVIDTGLERFLTNIRHLMLNEAGGNEPDDRTLAFYCALARQCFFNNYVFSLAEGEVERAQRLRATLEERLAEDGTCPALLLVAVACYFPLHSVTNANRLLALSWPQSVKALLVRQVEEPAEERDIAADLRTLSNIADDVTDAVRRQYEESPYPRWLRPGPPAQIPPFDERNLPSIRDVLIAGCGTGLYTSELAQQATQARFLAIDLSRASLAYAKRMAQKLGLKNIEFAQCDLMQATSLGREFDFIESSGVLHHLANPWEGWRRLVALLRPGGMMQIGLYSKIARQNVTAARALIRERGYQATPEDIRRCREEILASDDALLRSLTRAADFFTVDDCRDLLFNVQEHQITLPEIKAFLADTGLEFVGFNLETPVMNRFAMRFKSPEAVNDLDCWHTFETEAPDTFFGMYQFWVRKPNRQPVAAGHSRQEAQ